MLWLDWLVALPKGLAQGLESLGDFWSLANGSLERPKKVESRMPWLDWLAGSWTLPKCLEQGLESLGDFWSLANGTAERLKK